LRLRQEALLLLTRAFVFEGMALIFLLVVIMIKHSLSAEHL
jgi:hypothetical protein